MDVSRLKEDAKDDLATITDQIHDGIERGKYTISELQKSLVDRTKQYADCTNKLVQENPWSAIGIAVGIGAIIGFLIRKK